MAYMHLKYQLEEHGTGFPSNLLTQEYAGHLLNIKLSKDRDNGEIIAADPEKWISWDLFEEGEVGTFKGIVVDRDQDGNYLVLVTETDGTACLLYQKPLTPYESPREFLKEKAFYNAKGDIVRSYVLYKWDRFSSSASNFSEEPEIGAKVTGVADGKMTITQP